jgi:hypothetical protein
LTLTAFAALSPGPAIPDGLRIGNPEADLNGDGLIDLVHGRYVLMNLGGGNFVRHELGLPGWDAVSTTLDMNGDGLDDLIVHDNPTAPPGSEPAKRKYQLFINGGNLNFGTGIDIPYGDGLPHAADVDGDGLDDLVVLTGIKDIGTEVRAYLSRGDGTFTARAPGRIPKNPQEEVFSPTRLLVGDFNRDGIRDLVFRTELDLVVLRGTGSGKFGDGDARFFPYGGGNLRVGDIDGDGNLDILAAGPRTVRVFFGDGTAHFPRFQSVRIARLREYPDPRYNYDQTSPNHIAIGEFVRKGRTEIAVAMYEGDVVVLAYENGKLQEVNRMTTDVVNPTVYSNAFMEVGKTDLYMSWLTGGTGKAALVIANPAEPLFATAVPKAGRARAVRGFASTKTTYDVMITGTCASFMDTWTLQREGAFGIDRNEERLIETITDGGDLTFRLTVPWAAKPAIASLTPTADGWQGRMYAETACGGNTKFQVKLTKR